MKDRFLGGEVTLCPDSVSYTLTLNSYTLAIEMAAAEGMLFEMVDDFLTGNAAAEPKLRKLKMRRRSLTKRIVSCRKISQNLENERVTAHFNTVMDMFARSDTLEASERAIRVHSRFQELSNSGLLKMKSDFRLDMNARFARSIHSREPKSILKRQN